MSRDVGEIRTPEARVVVSRFVGPAGRRCMVQLTVERHAGNEPGIGWVALDPDEQRELIRLLECAPKVSAT